MQLTWTEAIGAVLEPTELGYTLRSLDRLWTVFIFDEWSEDEFRFNRLFSTGLGQPWSYEMWETELVWTTRIEAERFAQRLRDDFEGSEGTPPEVYVINIGDDRRHERSVIEGVPLKCHFRGSQRALTAMALMHHRWVEFHQRLEHERRMGVRS